MCNKNLVSHYVTAGFLAFAAADPLSVFAASAPVGVTASSQLIVPPVFYRPASAAINPSDPTNNAPDVGRSMWLNNGVGGNGNPYDFSPQITFDLGNYYFVHDLVVYNY